MELKEIIITPSKFPPSFYIMKLMKNKIYQIPCSIMPAMKTYEIEVDIQN